MRQCYTDLLENKEDSIALNSCKFAEEVQERFAQEKQYAAMVDAVRKFMGTPEESAWRDIMDQVVEYD